MLKETTKIIERILRQGLKPSANETARFVLMPMLRELGWGDGDITKLQGSNGSVLLLLKSDADIRLLWNGCAFHDSLIDRSPLDFARELECAASVASNGYEIELTPINKAFEAAGQRRCPLFRADEFLTKETIVKLGSSNSEDNHSNGSQKDLLSKVVERVSAILQCPIVRHERNSYKSIDGEKIIFSMTSPYKGDVEQGFVKISPLHLTSKWIVIWKNARPEGWMLPSAAVTPFLDTLPMSKRKLGAKTWDARIGLRSGRDYLWTKMENGSLDVTEYRFDFADTEIVESGTEEPNRQLQKPSKGTSVETASAEIAINVPCDGCIQKDQPESPDDGGRTEGLRLDLLSAVEQIESVTLRRVKRNGPFYVDDDKKFAVIAVPSKRYPADEFWYTVFNRAPDGYFRSGMRVMFAFGMSGEREFLYIPYADMQSIIAHLHPKKSGAGWYMHLRVEKGSIFILRARRARVHVATADAYRIAFPHSTEADRR